VSNSNGRYVLDGHVPLEEPHLLVWGRWLEMANRSVADETVGDVRISTVFLGLDHGFGARRPILFETMVFGGPLDQECERYATWDEAEEGHRIMRARVIAATTSPAPRDPLDPLIRRVLDEGLE
jgi:hypothetical protein